jgi:cephalosporin-C deacetylase-like acetyl esterase
VKIIKRILKIVGVFIGIYCVYLLIIAVIPGMSVPEQPFPQKKEQLHSKKATPAPYRNDVIFNVDEAKIHAWFYLPGKTSNKVPCIVMGHGFGGTKEMGLDGYARRFQKAGFAVLVFDYRHYGQSEGEPRHLVWIPYQHEDWKAAIKYVRSREEVNPQRIALWGTSFSGGHVLVTAASDNSIRCISAQCPGLDGHEAGEELIDKMGIGYGLRILVHGQRDIVRGWLGLSAHKIPLVGKPGTFAAMTLDDAYKHFEKGAPTDYKNEVCARIFLRGGEYRPIEYAHKVQCPVLLLVCEKDQLAPARTAYKTAEILGDKAELKKFPISHFDIYSGKHREQSIKYQLVFFKKHLN